MRRRGGLTTAADRSHQGIDNTSSFHRLVRALNPGSIGLLQRRAASE